VFVLNNVRWEGGEGEIIHFRGEGVNKISGGGGGSNLLGIS